MASTKLDTLLKSVKFSPRETRLLQALSRERGWVPTRDLCTKEFGEADHKWPLNATHIVTAGMLTIAKKLAHAGKPPIAKRGGGRLGNEYKW